MTDDLKSTITDLRAKAEALSPTSLAHIKVVMDEFGRATSPTTIIKVCKALEKAWGELAERRMNLAQASEAIQKQAAEIAILRAELGQYKTALADPSTVYINMLHGTIATPEHFKQQAAELATLRAENERLRKTLHSIAKSGPYWEANDAQIAAEALTPPETKP